MPDRRHVLIFMAALSVSGVMPRPGQAQQAALPVLASFSILADMARQIGGDRVSVTELIGPEQDAHGFAPGPQEIKKLGAAKIILINGLGFEPYLPRLMKSAGSTLTPVALAASIKPLDKPKGAGGHSHTHGHDQGNADPHAWQSIPNAKAFARTIAETFSAADPVGKADFEARLVANLAALDALRTESEAALAAIPVERRMLVTTHNAFRYFARDFGLNAEALQGISTESEPSAADMARIIRQLRALKAPAVFLENITDPRKIEMIARESGAKIGGTLYSDSLSLANGPAPTYIDMMRHNVREIARVLK